MSEKVHQFLKDRPSSLSSIESESPHIPVVDSDNVALEQPSIWTPGVPDIFIPPANELPLLDQVHPAVLHRWMKRRLSLWSTMSGVKVDHRDFQLLDMPHLYPMFADRSEDIRVMKAAQRGATIFMLLKASHMCLYPDTWGFPHAIKVGFYFPEKSGVSRLVKDRYIPLQYSCPDLEPYAGEQRQDMRPVGDSTLYFLFMAGTSTKDSVPLNALFIDEVRLISLDDIYQAYARLFASKPWKWKTHVSTAGYPDNDIHFLFLDSDQKWYYTTCEHCGMDQILSEEFPNCIAEPAPHSTIQRYYYICKNPRCRKEITDPKQGKYIAHNPGHEFSGFQFSQLCGGLDINGDWFVSPKQVMQMYRTTKDMKEFYNSVIGVPFVDETNRPIHMGMLPNFVNTMLDWGDPLGETCYAGIDQMMNLCYMWIIARRGQKYRVVWFEVIEGSDPFRRCGQLMNEYDVYACVCDALPNANEALRFAQDFEGKVFLAYYGEQGDAAWWDDDYHTPKKYRKVRKGTYSKYKVHFDKYKSYSFTLSAIATGQVEWPDPKEHIVTCRPYKGGLQQPLPVMITHAYPHFCSAVREQVVREEAQAKKTAQLTVDAYKYRWIFLGCDPHALSALNNAIWATERKVRKFTFSM